MKTKPKISSVPLPRVKVLDPAVGSGAFPMGILHKLTLVLAATRPGTTNAGKNDKKSSPCRGRKQHSIRKTKQERDAELLEISETFENYSGDFGHKLYLIQNNIFGVDVQPIACQIAKLRFFISLAIEQEPDLPRRRTSASNRCPIWKPSSWQQTRSSTWTNRCRCQ